MANLITDVAGIKNVRMTNARFARAPIASLFTGWTTLRIALFVQWLDSGGNITGTPSFAFGLCSGNANIMGDATTTHFCGAISTVATWTRATSPLRYTGVTIAPAKKVGTTLTLGTNFTTAAMAWLTQPSFFFVDITVGSPNYSMRLICPTASPAGTPTEAEFLAQSVAGVPAQLNHVYQTAQTVAVDEATNGVFDHACVWWNQASPSVDILNWRVYRLA